MDPKISMFDPFYRYDMYDEDPDSEDVQESEDDISEALESIQEEEAEDERFWRKH